MSTLSRDAREALLRCAGHYDRTPYWRNFYLAEDHGRYTEIPMLNGLVSQGLMTLGRQSHGQSIYHLTQAGCAALSLDPSTTDRVMRCAPVQEVA